VCVYSGWSWVASVGLQQDEKDSVLILPRGEERGEEREREKERKGETEKMYTEKRGKETAGGLRYVRGEEVKRHTRRREGRRKRRGERKGIKERRKVERKGKMDMDKDMRKLDWKACQRNNVHTPARISGWTPCHPDPLNRTAKFHGERLQDRQKKSMK